MLRIIVLGLVYVVAASAGVAPGFAARKIYFSCIPKTAPTTTRAVINGSACLGSRVTAIQHGRCNGSSATYGPEGQRHGGVVNAAAPRGPCARFLSAFGHVHQLKTAGQAASITIHGTMRLHFSGG